MFETLGEIVRGHFEKGDNIRAAGAAFALNQLLKTREKFLGSVSHLAMKVIPIEFENFGERALVVDGAYGSYSVQAGERLVVDQWWSYRPTARPVGPDFQPIPGARVNGQITLKWRP